MFKVSASAVCSLAIRIVAIFPPAYHNRQLKRVYFIPNMKQEFQEDTCMYNVMFEFAELSFENIYFEAQSSIAGLAVLFGCTVFKDGGHLQRCWCHGRRHAQVLRSVLL